MLEKNRGILYIVSISSLIILSEISLRSFSVDSKFLPYPSMVLKEIVYNFSEYRIASISTIETILFGLIPAILFGWLFAFLSYELKFLHVLIHPILSFTQLIPKTALIPIFLTIPILGYSWQSNVLITFLISFFPVYLDVYLGLSLIKSDYLLLFESFNVSPKKKIKYLKVPFTIPFLFNGLKFAALYSVIGAVTSEILIGKDGIGYLIDYSSTKLEYTKAFAGIFFCVFVGFLLQVVVLSIRILFFSKNYEDREN